MCNHKTLIISVCLFAILLIVNYSAAVHPRTSNMPSMVNPKDYPNSCCLPRKISLKGSVMKVSFLGNDTSTYFSTMTINDDLDNGKARSDVTNTNLVNTTIISYLNGQTTYSYTIVWGKTCFCGKTNKNLWANNYCTNGKLLEESNIGFNKAQKYGTEFTMQRGFNRYINTEYYWTLPIDEQSCIFSSFVQGMTNSEGSYLKNIQYYGASYQVDANLFTIPQFCPPESQCEPY